jgi:hypothetical protein
MSLALQMMIGQQVAEVLDCGLMVEPAGGTSAAWSAVLGKHGVPPIDEATRYDGARAQGQTRGAPLDEVRLCLERIALAGKAAIKQIDDPDMRANLEAFLDRLPVEVFAHYKGLACKKASMFGHALQSAKRQQYADIKAKAYVLTCPTCGGPRLKNEHFRCSYCGGTFT